MKTSDDKKGSPRKRKRHMQTTEVIDVENYLRENGITTVRERIEYLKRVDPNNIPPDLVKLGLKSKADLDYMIQLEEQMDQVVSKIGKVVINNPIFDVGRDDSALSTIAHATAVNGLAAQLAESFQTSFNQQWAADVAKIAESFQTSFNQQWAADVAKIGALLQQSFGGFEQLNLQLGEIGRIAGAAQENVRLGSVLEPKDLASHLGIDSGLQFDKGKPQNQLPAKSASPAEITAEEDLTEAYEEAFKIIKPLLVGIQKNNVNLSVLAMTTVYLLNNPSTLSNPATFLAIVIIWMLALGPLAVKGES